MSYEGVSRETINNIWNELSEIPNDVYEQIEIDAKYSGYLKRQLADIEVFKKDEKRANKVNYLKLISQIS